MRPWVDPGNNLVFADVHGTIGYRTAGACRSGARERVATGPGLGRRHEWTGTIPFEEMPALRDPGRGVDRHRQQPHRRGRLPALPRARLRLGLPDPPHRRAPPRPPRRDRGRHGGHPRGPRLDSRPGADGAGRRGSRRSTPARARRSPSSGAGTARWTSTARRRRSTRRSARAFVRDVLHPLLGPLASDAFASAPNAAVAHVARLRGRLADWIREGDRTLLRPGDDWGSVMARALAGAVATLRETLGPDPASWTWGRLHLARPRHPLSGVFPDGRALLDPPSISAGGDGDTVQAADFVPAAGFDLSLTSVARYVFDLGDWERSAWIVPLGASGHPGSPHYADQSPDWAAVRLRPMRYDWTRVAARGRDPPAPRADRRLARLVARPQPLMPGMSKPRAASPATSSASWRGGQLDQRRPHRPPAGVLDGSARWSPSAPGSSAAAAGRRAWRRSPPADGPRRPPATSGTGGRWPRVDVAGRGDAADAAVAHVLEQEHLAAGEHVEARCPGTRRASPWCCSSRPRSPSRPRRSRGRPSSSRSISPSVIGTWATGGM